MHEREISSRANYFDGQRITEEDLRQDQNYFRDAVSGISHDRGSFGVIDRKKDSDYVLLDLKNISLQNKSYDYIYSGIFDGKTVFVDNQPSDTVFGCRIEVSLIESTSMGRFSTKVLIVGLCFNDLDESGSIQYEILDFKENGSIVSKNYYTKILCISTNNYSGGLIDSNKGSFDSFKNLTETSNILIKEAKPLSVFSDTINFSQTMIPSHDAYNFGTAYGGFEGLLDQVLLPSRSKGEVYYDFSYEYEELSASGNISDVVGQKFISGTNNIQSISLMMSIETDSFWSGDIVFSLHKLSKSSNSRSSSDPISFDPEDRPIAQVALDKADMETIGIFLSSEPKKINIDFSRFECADPSSLKIQKNEYYALIIKRVGDNRQNSIRIYKGPHVSSGKINKNILLSPEEKFSKQSYKMFRFDGSNERYVDYSDQSLWMSANTSAIEVMPGSAYSVDGFYLNIPRSVPYVGDTRINNFKNKIDIPLFNKKLYVVLKRGETYHNLDVHPRTGDYIHTRVSDSVEISFIEPPVDLNENLILASVNDKNSRSFLEILGSFTHAGLFETNHFYIIRPSEYQKSVNYIGMNFIPDTACQCNNQYQIIKTELSTYRMGDLDRDGKYTLFDSEIISSISGNTLNSEATERRLFGGEFGIVDFYLSDLNNDGAVDGFDILKSEDAAKGFINFESGNSIEILKVYFENISDVYSDFIFEGSGTTQASTNNLEFLSDDSKKALAIRVGDIVTLSSSEIDTTLFVSEKTVASDGVTVTLSLKRSDGSLPSFVGSSATISILSKTQTNIFSDNINLLTTPYSEKKYRIFTDETEFRKINIDICDLRTKINFSRRKDKDVSCLCVGQHTCENPPVVESVVEGDLVVTGKILGESGLPYRSDIEFANIKIPIPAGSINGCSIDLYENFIKSNGSSCFTSNGLPALMFSDGTYVGCDDTDGNTDLDKNRIKFAYGIASLFVDTNIPSADVLVPNVEESESAVDYFLENFSNSKYEDFTAFGKILSTNATCVFETGTGSDPVNLKITTSAYNENAVAVGDQNSWVSGDFIIDIKGFRKSWDTPSYGEIRHFVELTIYNSDNTSGIMRLGYLSDASGLFLFSETENFDSGNNSIELKRDKVALSEDLLDITNFRLRRIDDSVKAYYFVDNDTSQESVLGVYKRIDSNPRKQIGYGDGKIKLTLESLSADSGKTYEASFKMLDVKSKYSSQQIESAFELYSDANGVRNEVTFNFPLNISSNIATTLSSATLTITPNETKSGSFPIIITGSKLVNARNFDAANNYYDIDDFFYSSSLENPIYGEPQSIDITQGILRFLTLRNFLSGSYRAMSIGTRYGSVSSIKIRSNISVELIYNDQNQNITYKVGVDLDTSTGIMTLRTKNVLFDALIKENRTVVSVGVLLKKSGFLNRDVEIDVESIKNIGVGNCIAEEDAKASISIQYCNTIAGYAMAGIVTGASAGYPCGETGPSSAEYGAQYFKDVVL